MYYIKINSYLYEVYLMLNIPRKYKQVPFFPVFVLG